MAAARLATLRAFYRPKNIIPALTVRDVRDIDFVALKRRGFDSVVFDKDNCLTLPHDDALVPVLQSSLDLCKATFGPERVLVVSNSSGTPSEDPGYIEAEFVERNLRCSVLRHDYKKPSKRCALDIQRYFALLPLPNNLGTPVRDDAGPRATSTLIVVGDRLLTDVLLANEMGAYAIWTTRLWQREALFIRSMERAYLFLVRRWLDYRNRPKSPPPPKAAEVLIEAEGNRHHDARGGR